MDEVNKVNEVKITSVEKAKDPKKVDAGEKLGAMSKQAKEKKAIEKLSQKVDIDEFQIPSIDPLVVVGVIGFVGTVVYYKYFRSSKDVVVESRSKSEDPTPVSQVKQVKEKPKQRELDTLD